MPGQGRGVRGPSLESEAGLGRCSRLQRVSWLHPPLEVRRQIQGGAMDAR